MPESRDSLLADCQQLMAAGKWNEARSRLENGFAAAPADIVIALALAQVYQQSGEREKAASFWLALSEAAPGLPGVATGLSSVLADLGRFEEGTSTLKRIILQRPDLTDGYAGLGSLQVKIMDPISGSSQFRRSNIIAPDNAATLCNLAEALSLQNNIDEAEALYRSALRIMPNAAEIRMNFAAHLLSLGKTDEGWQHYEARLSPDYPSAPIRNLHLPRWDGSSPALKHLLVVSDQGIGDDIRHGAMLPNLAHEVASLTVECDPRLVGLFERSIPGIRAHGFSRHKRGGRGYYSYPWLPEENGPECYVEMGSLPFILRRPHCLEDNEQGYLVPEQRQVSAFETQIKALVGTRRAVGISWTSSVRTAIRNAHYPPMSAWKHLLDLPGVCFISLQHSADRAAIEAFMEETGVQIETLPDLDLRNDIEGVAALASCLDLVISVATATSAISAAVGTPTIDFLANAGSVPLINGRDTFLSATRRTLQKTPGDWSSPIIEARSIALDILRQT